MFVNHHMVRNTLEHKSLTDVANFNLIESVFVFVFLPWTLVACSTKIKLQKCIGTLLDIHNQWATPAVLMFLIRQNSTSWADSHISLFFPAICISGCKLMQRVGGKKTHCMHAPLMHADYKLITRNNSNKLGHRKGQKTHPSVLLRSLPSSSHFPNPIIFL